MRNCVLTILWWLSSFGSSEECILVISRQDEFGVYSV